MECFGELSPSRNKIPEKNITEVKTKITHLFQVLDFVRHKQKRKHFVSFCAISFPRLQVRQKCICGRETSPRTAAVGELTAVSRPPAACKRPFRSGRGMGTWAEFECSAWGASWRAWRTRLARASGRLRAEPAVGSRGKAPRQEVWRTQSPRS